MSRQNYHELLQILVNYFNIGELRTLAFDLNVDFEDLAGETMTQKAMALIEYAYRRGRLDDLGRYVMMVRPHVEWPMQDILAAESSSININIGNVGPGAAIGKGAVVRAENIAGRDIHISGQFLEKKDVFKEKMRELQHQVEVVLSREQVLSEEGLIVQENLKDILEQTSFSAPNTRWILLRLQDTIKVLKEISSVPNISQASIQIIEDSIEIADQLVTLSEQAFSSNK